MLSLHNNVRILLMRKTYLLAAIVCACLLLARPMVGKANTGIAIELLEQEIQNIVISVNSNVLHVTGANNQMLYIYNVAGVRIMSFKVEGNDKHYELNLNKGIYIVKVGKTVRKISLNR